MILTAIARYSIIAAIEIAQNQQEKNNKTNQNNLTLIQISQQNNIPLSCLEQIFSKLKKAKIVQSIKGPGGGYIFCEELNKIKLSQILLAVGEKIKITRCGGKNNCVITNKNLHNSNQDQQIFSGCKTHNLWHILEQGIFNYFNSISLANLVEQNSVEKLQNTHKSYNNSINPLQLQQNLIAAFNGNLKNNLNKIGS